MSHSRTTRSTKATDEVPDSGVQRDDRSETSMEDDPSQQPLFDSQITPQVPLPDKPMSDLAVMMQFMLQRDAATASKQDERLRRDEERREQDQEERREQRQWDRQQEKEKAQQERLDRQKAETEQRNQDRADRERLEQRMANSQASLERRWMEQEQARTKESQLHLAEQLTREEVRQTEQRTREELRQTEQRTREDTRQSKMDVKAYSQAFSSFKKLTDPKELEALLHSFEEVAELNEIPRNRWVLYLTPLLDEVSATCRNGMPNETRSDYDVVKEALMSLHNFHRGYYRAHWEMLHWKEREDASYLNILNDLKITQVAWSKIEDDAKDWMLQEQFIRVLHPDIKNYVILQDPKTAKDAAMIADHFYAQSPRLPHLRPSQRPPSQP